MMVNLAGEKRIRIAEISAELDGAEIALRARVHNLRLQGDIHEYWEGIDGIRIKNGIF